MRISRLLFATALFFAIITFPVFSFADHEDPTFFVQIIVGEFLDILKSEENKDVQGEKILNLLQASFDFRSITESLLKGLRVSDADKSALTEIFPVLLQMRYGVFVKSSDSFTVKYERSEFLYAGLEAVVYTHTKVPAHDLALNYKLRHRDGNWKIYDITVGDVSLVGNYRAQIHKVLSQRSFADLLSHLEKMVGKKVSAVDNR